MSPRRGASRAGRVWLPILAGFGGLAVAGFGLGMLAGVLWQEPGLVVGHLLGETQEIAWSEEAATASEPSPRDVAAPPAPERPEVAAPPAAAPEPVPEAMPQAGPQSGHAVQVGAFGDSRAAESLADTLRQKGFPAYVTPGARSGEARWRVRVGPFEKREEAQEAARRLKAVEKLPTWVLAEEG